MVKIETVMYMDNYVTMANSKRRTAVLTRNMRSTPWAYTIAEGVEARCPAGSSLHLDIKTS